MTEMITLQIIAAFSTKDSNDEEEVWIQYTNVKDGYIRIAVRQRTTTISSLYFTSNVPWYISILFKLVFFFIFHIFYKVTSPLLTIIYFYLLFSISVNFKYEQTSYYVNPKQNCIIKQTFSIASCLNTLLIIIQEKQFVGEKSIKNKYEVVYAN